MLVLDNSLLTEYLDGRHVAASFLDDWEADSWAIPSLVAHEAYMGAVHGYLEADVATVRSGIQSAMDVLEITETTAAEAARIQETLLTRGVPAEQHDALIVASASEHGATFATADQFFWRDEVRDVLSVAEYNPDR